VPWVESSSRHLREDDFAAAAACYLNRGTLGGEIEQLVIVADPRTLANCASIFTTCWQAS
jgi:protein required for attachment to host cells